MISGSPFFPSATSSFSSQRQVVPSNFPPGNFSQNRLIFTSTVLKELWHFPIFPIRLAMLIFPNKSRYGVSSPSPRYPPIFIYYTFFRISIRNLSFSRRREEWKKNWWVRKHRSASRVCLSFIASVPRFSPLSLSLFLSGNFDISFLLSDRWKRITFF